MIYYVPKVLGVSEIYVGVPVQDAIQRMLSKTCARRAITRPPKFARDWWVLAISGYSVSGHIDNFHWAYTGNVQLQRSFFDFVNQCTLGCWTGGPVLADTRLHSHANRYPKACHALARNCLPSPAGWSAACCRNSTEMPYLLRAIHTNATNLPL
jgi:hypothetical protein